MIEGGALMEAIVDQVTIHYLQEPVDRDRTLIPGYFDFQHERFNRVHIVRPLCCVSQLSDNHRSLDFASRIEDFPVDLSTRGQA